MLDQNRLVHTCRSQLRRTAAVVGSGGGGGKGGSCTAQASRSAASSVARVSAPTPTKHYFEMAAKMLYLHFGNKKKIIIIYKVDLDVFAYQE